MSFEMIEWVACWFRHIDTPLRLDEITSRKVASTIGGVLGRSLTMISAIMMHTGGVAVAVDGASKGMGTTTKVFAIRVRMFVGGETIEIHVASIEMETEDSQSLFDAFTALFDALDPNWDRKLMFYTSDGANVVRGMLLGLAGRLQRHCGLVGNPLETFWCVAHRTQLGLKSTLRTCTIRTDGVDKCVLAPLPTYDVAEEDEYANAVVSDESAAEEETEAADAPTAVELRDLQERMRPPRPDACQDWGLEDEVEVAADAWEDDDDDDDEQYPDAEVAGGGDTAATVDAPARLKQMEKERKVCLWKYFVMSPVRLHSLSH
eukprot:GHVU01016404.1.p1 GENE.GHVU01016404.1~~GHVU01016404.1.p1  ORF type:complete len:319 (-),score=51.35 GHVU01016404.1:212-1168(-)